MPTPREPTPKIMPPDEINPGPALPPQPNRPPPDRRHQWPMPDPDKVGDDPVIPPERKPFPDTATASIRTGISALPRLFPGRAKRL